MAKKSAGVEVDKAQLNAARAKLRGLDKETNSAIGDAAGEIAQDELARIENNAAGDPLSEVVAQGLTLKRDRFPAIKAGGPGKVTELAGDGRKTPTYGDLFFGAEFGGRGKATTQQFRPHKGRDGYWLYPQLREDAPRMLEQWGEVVDKIVKDWER